MKIYPKITIVTPVFNRVEFLEETILSVINQNYPNLEYIIIDGGSTDGTLEIINKYEEHIKLWISEIDQGMYHAIQKGFEQSSGSIMAWLNSDDKYNIKSLFNVAQIFEDLPDVDWIVGIPSMYNYAGLCVQVSPGRKWSNLGFNAGYFKWIQQESSFWRRSLWEKAGGTLSTKYKYAGDFELWYRFFNHAQLHSVGTLIGGFRLHGNQISVKDDKMYEAEVFEILQTAHLNNNLNTFTKIKIPFNKLKIWAIKTTVRFLKYAAKKFSYMSENIIHSPKDIYYDFAARKWKK